MKDRLIKYGAIPALGIAIATSAFAFAASDTVTSTSTVGTPPEGRQFFGGKGGHRGGDIKGLTAEERAKMEAEHEARFTTMLASKVQDGTITQAEADQVIASEKVIKAQKESVRSIMEKIKPIKQK